MESRQTERTKLEEPVGLERRNYYTTSLPYFIDLVGLIVVKKEEYLCSYNLRFSQKMLIIQAGLKG